MWKYDQEIFFFTYVESKHQSNYHNEDSVNDIQCLIWIFCQSSPMWYKVDCFQLICQFYWYHLQLLSSPGHGASSSEKSVHKTSQITIDTFD